MLVLNRYEINHAGRKVTIKDRILGGTLLLVFKPVSVKEGSDLVFGTMNDIVTGLSRKELLLSLTGFSTITVKSDVKLAGEVKLKSSHLTDAELINSDLTLVNVKSRASFINTTLSHFGYTKYGYVRFEQCAVSKLQHLSIPHGRCVNVIRNIPVIIN